MCIRDRQEGDTIIFFNFRNDRAKELTIVLTQEDKPEFGMKTMPLHYCTMTPYDAKFKGCLLYTSRVGDNYFFFYRGGVDVTNRI